MEKNVNFTDFIQTNLWFIYVTYCANIKYARLQLFIKLKYIKTTHTHVPLLHYFESPNSVQTVKSHSHKF